MAVPRLLGILLAALAAAALLASVAVQARFGAGVGPLLAAILSTLSVLAVALAMARMRPRAALILALVLGVGLRLSLTATVGRAMPDTDPLAYAELSDALLAGEGLIRNGNVAYYPPLYPLLLAVVRAVVPPVHIAALLLDTALGVAAAALTFAIGRRWMADNRAAAAAGTVFLWPTLIVSATYPGKDTLAIVAVLALVACLLRVGNRPERALPAAGVGLAWAALALTQGALALLPAFLIGAVLLTSPRSWREWLAPAVIAAASLAVTMSPWWLRNYLLLGELVPLTTAGGFAFLGPLPFEALTSFGITPGMSEVDVAAATLRAALSAIAADPIAYVTGAAVGAGRAMAVEIGSAQQLLYAHPMPSAALIAMLMMASQLAYAGLLGAAAVRLWRWRGPTTQLHLVLAAALVALVAVNSWMQFHERHRYFLVPLLLLFAFQSRSGRMKPAALDPEPGGVR